MQQEETKHADKQTARHSARTGQRTDARLSGRQGRDRRRADCLAARELIKLRVLETSPYTAKEAAAILAEKTGADCVQVIGSKFVLYLEKKKDSKYAELIR